MSTPLEDLFERTRSENRAALIGFIPAGFPSHEGGVEIIRAMIDGGVDAIEVGFPYSDPVMDGPIIQAASEQSLAHGTTAHDVMATVAAVSPYAPTVIMTYWNPIERYGVDAFVSDLNRGGGSGVITPDLTVEESAPWMAATLHHDRNRIFVVAPSTSDERLEKVVSATSGFIYAASLMGVTGTRTSVSSGAQELVTRLRRITEKPIAVGLGVSTPEQAHEVAQYADGVIVGSAFIRAIQDAPSQQAAIAAVAELARNLAAAMSRG